MYKYASVSLLFMIIMMVFIGCDNGISYDYYLRSDLFGKWYRCKRTDYSDSDTSYRVNDRENSDAFLVIDQQFFREYLKRGGYILVYKYQYWLMKNILGRKNSSDTFCRGHIAFRDDTLCIPEPGYGTDFFFLPYDGSIPPDAWPDSVVVEE
jgi:hypothetical protein